MLLYLFLLLGVNCLWADSMYGFSTRYNWLARGDWYWYVAFANAFIPPWTGENANLSFCKAFFMASWYLPISTSTMFSPGWRRFSSSSIFRAFSVFLIISWPFRFYMLNFRNGPKVVTLGPSRNQFLKVKNLLLSFTFSTSEYKV